jgi:hypothetical protein
MARARISRFLLPTALAWCACIGLAGACGDGDNAPEPSQGTAGASGAAGSVGVTSPAVTAAVRACAAYCDVLPRDSCPALNTLEECREFCDRNARDIETDCLDEYTAHYLCIARFEPTCVGPGAVRANETMCQVELRAQKACSNTLCTGSDELGVCPTITCPCPGGPKTIAGFPNDGARPCRCYDSTTCVPYCKYP